MNSTTTSEEVLSVRNLDLVFRLNYYRPKTVRDLFVEAVDDPLGSLLKAKDSLHVLKNINFSLKKGERLAILGINGSGKTSLCRCIAGMLDPAAGSIQISGVCRAVFDAGAGVIPELTGRENARLLATLFYPNSTPAEIDDLVRDATEFSELGSFLDVPFETYSAGMKARLFLSVVTAKTTELLILDEVYDNTDRFFRQKMSARLNKAIHSSDAFIFVSHSPELARKLCNRAIVIHESKIAFDGTIDNALKAYDFLNGVSPEVITNG